MISKSGTRLSWPLVNVKLTHFIFSHLPFSVHTSAISARSLLSVCVCVLRVLLVTEFTWAVSSGVVELVRPARPDPGDVRDGGVVGEGRCEIGGPSEHMYACSVFLHAKVCVCVGV